MVAKVHKILNEKINKKISRPVRLLLLKVARQDIRTIDSKLFLFGMRRKK